MRVVQVTQACDLGAVLEVIRAAFAEQSGRIDPPSSMTTLSVLDIYNHLETEQVWGVWDGGGFVACVFGTAKADVYYLSKLSVHPNARGRGYAARLLDVARDHAAKAGFKELEVIVRIEMVQNHAMFRKFGFVKTGEGRHPGYDRTTEFHFRKPI